MGKLCSKQTQSSSEQVNGIPQEKEIIIPLYKSDADKYFEINEKKYNYLTKINFVDYLDSLINFSKENATLDDDYSSVTLEHSSNHTFYSESISPDMFQSFIENKILKHKLLYEESQNKETATAIFKKIASESYIGLRKKLAQNFNKKVDEDDIITKGYLIPLGILHCSGPKFIKIRTIFNLFKENEKIKTNEKLNEFLLVLFLTAGYCSIHVRNEIACFDEIEGLTNADVVRLTDTLQLRDSKHLVEVTNKLIFGEDLSQNLGYEDFKAKFGGDNKDISLGFMLSPPGVRYMQTLHNV